MGFFRVGLALMGEYFLILPVELSIHSLSLGNTFGPEGYTATAIVQYNFVWLLRMPYFCEWFGTTMKVKSMY